MEKPKAKHEPISITIRTTIKVPYLPTPAGDTVCLMCGEEIGDGEEYPFYGDSFFCSEPCLRSNWDNFLVDEDGR